MVIGWCQLLLGGSNDPSMMVNNTIGCQMVKGCCQMVTEGCTLVPGRYQMVPVGCQMVPNVFHECECAHLGQFDTLLSQFDNPPLTI